jgi:hypothetical protein
VENKKPPPGAGGGFSKVFLLNLPDAPPTANGDCLSQPNDAMHRRGAIEQITEFGDVKFHQCL